MNNLTKSDSCHHPWKFLFLTVFLSICHAFRADAQTTLVTPNSGGNIWEIQPTPNRAYVVLRGDLDGDGRGDLHSVPTAGGSAIMLDEVAPGGDIWEMKVSNTHVVYRGRRDAGSEDLYSILLDGTGSPIKLLGVPSTDGNIYDNDWRITPDGTKVFVAGRLDDNGSGGSDNDVDLWSFPIGGGAATILTEYSGDFWQVKVSNTHAVYRGRIDGDGNEDIYSVSLNGNLNIQIAEAAPGGDIEDNGWEISPDGASIIYGGNVDGNGDHKLLRKPAGGGSSTTLDDGMRGLWQIKLTSTHVVYRGRIDNDNDSEDLFSVPISGGTPMRLVEASGGDIEDGNWKTSPDGNYVIYDGNIDGNGGKELFSVGINGSPTTQLYENAREIWETKVSNTHVVFRGRADNDDFEDLYSVPLNRSTEPVQLAEAGTNDADLNDNDWKISPDGKEVVFNGDLETNDVRELYAISINGGTRYKLNGTLQSSGTVEGDYFVGNQNVRVFFRADATVDGRNELFVADLFRAPTAITLSQSSVAENLAIGFTIGTFTTTDENANDTHTYSLVSGPGGIDNASFQILGDQLRSAAVFNVDLKSSYSIRVRTNDNKGGLFEQTFTITITEPNQAPTDITLSNASIMENVASGTTVGTFTTIDENANDTHTYSLVSGTGGDDNASFQIIGNQLKNVISFNFAIKSSYSVRIQTDDNNGGTFEETFTITITAEPNQSPTAITLSQSSIAESVAVGFTIGTFTTTDANVNDTHTYSLVSGTGSDDNGFFEISGSDLRNTIVFDVDIKSSYSIRVRTNDNKGGTFEQTFTITITEPNQAPTSITLSNSSIVEKLASGTTIGMFTTNDGNANDMHAYTLVSGTGGDDNSSFQIVGNELISAISFNFNTKSSYSILVQTDDRNGGTFSQAFTITITAEPNQNPTGISLSQSSIAENVAAGKTIGTFTTTDDNVDDTHTYSLVSGTGDDGNAFFQIVGNELQNAAVFNVDIKSLYSIRVRTDDSKGGTFEQTFTITITEPNQEPIGISLSNSTVMENVAMGFTIGTFTTIDENANDTHNYSLVSGTGGNDNAAFQIVGNELKSAVLFDFSVKSSYSILVRTDDGQGGQLDKVFVVTITSFIKTAQIITFELASDEVFENEGPVTLIATASSGLPVTFNVTSGPGHISGNQLTIVGPGEIVIEASQAGNEEFAASPTVSRTLTVKVVTGVEGQLKYSVYPNPTVDNVTIEIQQSEATLYLTDLNGKLSKQERFNGKTTIDLQNLPSGIYVIKVGFKNGDVLIKRIIKN
jgi:Secretion system C-terminal sorting domain